VPGNTASAISIVAQLNIGVPSKNDLTTITLTWLCQARITIHEYVSPFLLRLAFLTYQWRVITIDPQGSI
jgi:hypothetical protein